MRPHWECSVLGMQLWNWAIIKIVIINRYDFEINSVVYSAIFIPSDMTLIHERKKNQEKLLPLRLHSGYLNQWQTENWIFNIPLRILRIKCLFESKQTGSWIGISFICFTIIIRHNQCVVGEMSIGIY